MAEGGAEKSKRVVVVGGGIGGGFIAKILQSSQNEVTLIDPKEYLEIPWAQLRSMVEPSFAERTLIKHSEYLTGVTIVSSHATNVTNHEVQTADGRTFPYDYLVVATGHPGSNKVNIKDRLSHFQQDYEKIKSSNSILIIGGGPTGVELAGEIAVDFPEKKVTLVHKGSRLMEFIGPKASRKTFNWLVKKKVEVILGQTVDLESLSESGVYVTSGGEKISADCHFVCVGKPVASSWLHDSILKQSLDNKGQLMVDANLRVKGRDNIFAVGDITDVPEIKQGFLAEGHASVAAKNLQLLIKGAPEKKLATYKASPPIALVSLGRKEGVAQFPFVTLSGCLPGKIKSKDLFVGKTRKALGLKSA
ncbi:apoptosis-inducing factor homolog B [Dendrobium catenatum]|uniref:NADH dehydrogenase C1, chloroplastic/mitochondrial n=1 Tax=Dendrobium catenatum TaxID=906689 RepID=A0A2I0W1Q4_9ASPA|nr:apoptosis-inducing factor homolog B [Dendrobium catenatum]PKU69599.1 NADH dehydrogenase C1, chloroplastic/mitochondrial [Dendrobium catenatum]